MIVYRKTAQLRIKRVAAPEPPFWCATAVSPYSARRGSPVSIDYIDLRASASDRLDVAVSERVRDDLERARMTAPVLIDASEFAEAIFRRGEDVLEFCDERGLAAVHLVSTRGALPEKTHADATIVIASWPLDFDRLDAMFADARGAWGVAVPVLYPVTTEITALEQLADAAKARGARFLAGVVIEPDATAKQAIARSLSTDGDDETYAMLFHSRLEPVHVATERHIAALAAERGMEDFIVPPRWEEKSNWNAAVLLTLTAARMLTMEDEIDLAALLARSARVVADLDKPLTRIAEAASLSIIGALDEVSAGVLTDWLATGDSAFVRRVNERWRLRRGQAPSSASPSPSS